MAYGNITVRELAALGDEARIVDVREPDEWADAHIPHAIHVALGTVPEHIDRFDGVPTYVICRSGGRSARACEFAADQGLDVANVEGGMLAWLDADLVVQGSATDA